MSSRQHFGTDGIRGTVGRSPITPDFMLRLGHAVGRVLRRGEAKQTVLIGKDTRISGYMIESALEAGFASAGVEVLLTGPLPTPGVAYLTRALRQDLGVVISASHDGFSLLPDLVHGSLQALQLAPVGVAAGRNLVRNIAQLHQGGLVLLLGHKSA